MLLIFASTSRAPVEWRMRGVATTGAEVGDREYIMNNIIWLVGAVVIVLFIAGFLGFR
jgi:hypothetical protein